MGFFSRNNGKALDGSDGTAFDTVRRSTRNSRARAASDSRFDAGAPLDPADATRRRARHRLIGAIALALAAIVFVPMLFNATPVAPPDDIALQIPDRDTPFEGRRGVPDPAQTPLKPSRDPPATPVVASPVVPAAEPKTVETPAPAAVVDTPVGKPAPAVERTAEKTFDKPTEKPSAKPQPAATEKAATEKAATEKAATEKAATDDPRALAALEGRTEPAKKPAAADATGGKGYAVQVAAYASADTARGERDHLVANGLKAYTESVATSQGLRVRVRLGPFATRDAADQARARLKTMKLDGSVVPL